MTRNRRTFERRSDPGLPERHGAHSTGQVPAERHPTRLLRLALAVTLLLAALRTSLALSTGFGDSEALYASYALYPQPAYLDHPGLIGLVGRLLGGGAAPTPSSAHLFSTLVSSLVPWLGAAASRLAGAEPRGALFTALGLMLVPELAIGLYGFTPDLLLCVGWLAALAAAAAALRAEPGSLRAWMAMLLTGALVGLSTLAKVTGVLLGLALLVALLTLPDRRHRAWPGPWIALALGLVLLSPLVLWESSQGWPMLRHRLVDTQSGAGFSLRNLGALIGGQLVYLSPPFFWGACLLLRDLWQKRRHDDVSWLLWVATVVPGLPLLVLCLWSRVSEPHWLAPALLPLGLHLARSSVLGPRLARFSLATGGVLVLLAWALVRTPLLPRWLGSRYEPRYDLTNDLYAWGPARSLLKEAVLSTLEERYELPVVVGPHWTVCAQAQAALGPGIPVGCNGPLRDDFDRWLPRQRWLGARVILYVHDDRFRVDPRRELGRRRVTATSRVGVRRGGRVVRTIYVTRLELEQQVAVLHP